MTRIDPLLQRRLIGGDMPDQLMARQTQRQCMLRSPSDDATKAIHVEPKRGFHVVDRKGEMKDGLIHELHCFSPVSNHLAFSPIVIETNTKHLELPKVRWTVYGIRANFNIIFKGS